jgi:hypothetical protein
MAKTVKTSDDPTEAMRRTLIYELLLSGSDAPGGKVIDEKEANRVFSKMREILRSWFVPAEEFRRRVNGLQRKCDELEAVVARQSETIKELSAIKREYDSKFLAPDQRTTNVVGDGPSLGEHLAVWEEFRIHRLPTIWKTVALALAIDGPKNKNRMRELLCSQLIMALWQGDGRPTLPPLTIAINCTDLLRSLSESPGECSVESAVRTELAAFAKDWSAFVASLRTHDANPYLLVPTKGEAFDPEHHEAFDTDLESGTIEMAFFPGFVVPSDDRYYAGPPVWPKKALVLITSSSSLLTC